MAATTASPPCPAQQLQQLLLQELPVSSAATETPPGLSAWSEAGDASRGGDGAEAGDAENGVSLTVPSSSRSSAGSLALQHDAAGGGKASSCSAGGGGGAMSPSDPNDKDPDERHSHSHAGGGRRLQHCRPSLPALGASCCPTPSGGGGAAALAGGASLQSPSAASESGSGLAGSRPARSTRSKRQLAVRGDRERGEDDPRQQNCASSGGSSTGSCTKQPKRRHDRGGGALPPQQHSAGGGRSRRSSSLEAAVDAAGGAGHSLQTGGGGADGGSAPSGGGECLLPPHQSSHEARDEALGGAGGGGVQQAERDRSGGSRADEWLPGRTERQAQGQQQQQQNGVCDTHLKQLGVHFSRYDNSWVARLHVGRSRNSSAKGAWLRAAKTHCPFQTRRGPCVLRGKDFEKVLLFQALRIRQSTRKGAAGSQGDGG